MVRAIFYTRSAEITGHSEDGRHIGKVTLTAAAKGPYKHWSMWTPAGELTLATLNPDAFAWFVERVGHDVAIMIGDPTGDDLKSE